MKALFALALLSMAALAGCSGSSGAGTTPSTDSEGRYVIDMTSGNRFSPSNAAVPVGAIVVWEHKGGAPHDVQAEDGTSFSSGPIGGLTEGEEYAHQFNQTGTFSYFCHVHEGSGMKATLTVA
ncbi:MAG: plastocyanin/azurin family copper-binding protein [Candidatus Thermoplasmatota archaeon]|jgi:plastocyanin